jgi:CRISPR-associated protein Cmr6
MISAQVQEWEARLFGGITPPKRGYLQVRIENGKLEQKEPRPNQRGKEDSCGQQSGILVLSYSFQTPDPDVKIVRSLMENLTWLMFQLGGIGQGARRPCYSRQTRDRAP